MVSIHCRTWGSSFLWLKSARKERFPVGPVVRITLLSSQSAAMRSKTVARKQQVDNPLLWQSNHSKVDQAPDAFDESRAKRRKP